jgi:hypothetical protein
MIGLSMITTDYDLDRHDVVLSDDQFGPKLGGTKNRLIAAYPIAKSGLPGETLPLKRRRRGRISTPTNIRRGRQSGSQVIGVEAEELVDFLVQINAAEEASGLLKNLGRSEVDLISGWSSTVLNGFSGSHDV